MFMALCIPGAQWIQENTGTTAMLLGSNWQFYAGFWTFFAEFIKQINHKNKILTSQ